MRVAVIAGGPSSEAAVSRASAKAVVQALSEVGHEAHTLELGEALPRALEASEFDVAFPVAHGTLGEDGCLQGLLEVLGVPYVGSGVLASALAADKAHAKAHFEAAGLAVAEGRVVERAKGPLSALAQAIRAELGRAVVVKPLNGGSAIGVSRISEQAPEQQLIEALEQAFEFDESVLVERFIVGHEVTCAVLEDEHGVPEALPPTLILPEVAEFYDFEAKYRTGGSKHVCPAPFDAALSGRIQQAALLSHRALGARDLSRSDFVVSGGDAPEVVVLELNTLPGMTATSLFPEAAAAHGIGFTDLCDRLVRAARARPERKLRFAPGMPG